MCDHRTESTQVNESRHDTCRLAIASAASLSLGGCIVIHATETCGTGTLPPGVKATSVLPVHLPVANGGDVEIRLFVATITDNPQCASVNTVESLDDEPNRKIACEMLVVRIRQMQSPHQNGRVLYRPTHTKYPVRASSRAIGRYPANRPSGVSFAGTAPTPCSNSRALSAAVGTRAPSINVSA